MSTEENKMSQVHMYYGFAHEEGCGGGCGIGRMFATKNEIPDSIIEKMSENDDEISWEYCGVLKPGEKLEFDIQCSCTFVCCSGYRYYQNFSITANQDEECEEECEEDSKGDSEEVFDQYDKYVITHDYISYSQALEECLEISVLSEIKSWVDGY